MGQYQAKYRERDPDEEDIPVGNPDEEPSAIVRFGDLFQVNKARLFLHVVVDRLSLVPEETSKI